MENISELIITGSASAATVGSILGYFLKRVIADIDSIQSVLNGKRGDAESKGLVALVHLNSSNDETTRKEIKDNNKEIEAMRKKLDDFMSNHYGNLDKRITKLESKK